MQERERRDDAPPRALYRVLLKLAPPRLRERHGGEMEDLFLDAIADAAARGRWAVVLAWAHAIRDVADARITDGTRRRTRRCALDKRKGLMLSSDIRSAFRSLRRQKLATALVTGMLSLGIAANVAVFSLVNGLFLRLFPFPDPDRLVSFNETAPKGDLGVVGIGYADFDTGRYSYSGIGRPKPGVSVQDAKADLVPAHQPVWDAHDKDKVVSPFARSLCDDSLCERQLPQDDRGCACATAVSSTSATVAIRTRRGRRL